MSRQDLGKRLAALESRVAELQEEMRSARPSWQKDWRRAVEEYTGDDDLQSVFAEALELRDADRKRACKPARAKSC
ncbi:MAG: hypothetical protein KJ000_32020 [Pirellulaceae bacterium]|nr:hypothetical protein [Pirellulaceae bacterium]